MRQSSQPLRVECYKPHLDWSNRQPIHENLKLPIDINKILYDSGQCLLEIRSAIEHSIIVIKARLKSTLIDVCKYTI